MGGREEFVGLYDGMGGREEFVVTFGDGLEGRRGGFVVLRTAGGAEEGTEGKERNGSEGTEGKERDCDWC